MLDIPTARTLLRQTRPRRHADGYPEDVRLRVTDLVRRRVGLGDGLTDIARELGANRGTLQRWLTAATQESPSGFVAVAVTAPPRPGPSSVSTWPSTRSEPLVVTSPSGFRLDGLTVDEAILVLRGLS